MLKLVCHLQSASKEEEEKLSLDNNILLEEDFEAGYEAEEDEDDEEMYEEEEDVEEEEEVKESTKMKILRLVAEVASKVKEIIGNLITTAGKVVVTILMGTTGECVSQVSPCFAFTTDLLADLVSIYCLGGHNVDFCLQYVSVLDNVNQSIKSLTRT